MRANRLRCLPLPVLLVALAAAPAPAAPPSHRIFVTSVAYDGDLGGLSGADSLCQGHANSGSLTASLGYTWRALLSVNLVVDAKDRFVWSGPLADVTGEVVTNDPGVWPWSDDGDSTLDVDENGDPSPDAFAWSGSTIAGVSKGAGFDCAGWTNGTGAENGWAGETGYFPDSNWFDSFASGCGDAWYSVYCVSDAKVFSDDFESHSTCSWSAQPGSGEICV